jgi:hypothetical protein
VYLEGDDVKFGRLIEALRPSLGHLVIVGGWAHVLFRNHPLARTVSYPPLRTVDADVAIAGRTRVGLSDLRQRLLDHGFKEEFRGDDRPPVTHYQLGSDSAFYAEFLTPLVGSGMKHGVADVTETVAGVQAQKLRYLEVLLIEPWRVPYRGQSGTHSVGIANPVGFIVQKLLISKRRAPEKQAKDVLYIHDTLELFGAALPELQRLWHERISGELTPPVVRRLKEATRRLFAEVNDVIRNAARIPTGRGLLPTRLLEACQVGLGRVLD